MVEQYIPAIAEDGSLFPMEKLEAHRKGAFHLAISIFVFDGDKLLMQRRALDKYHSGGLWTNTVCTHPHWNETVAEAAPRRLMEELGFSRPVTEVGTIDYYADVGSNLIENERVFLFTGNATEGDLVIKPNPEEVMDIRWLTMNEIRQQVSERPDQFTEWMKIYLDKLAGLFPN